MLAIRQPLNNDEGSKVQQSYHCAEQNNNDCACDHDSINSHGSMTRCCKLQRFTKECSISEPLYTQGRLTKTSCTSSKSIHQKSGPKGLFRTHAHAYSRRKNQALRDSVSKTVQFIHICYCQTSPCYKQVQLKLLLS